MALELIVTDWNGTLFQHVDDGDLQRELAYTAFRSDVASLFRGRVWRFPRVVTAMRARGALRAAANRWRDGGGSLADVYALYGRLVLRGRPEGFVTSVVDGFARRSGLLVDRRMLEPVRTLHTEGIATAVYSVAYDYGITRVLEEAGHADTFDSVVANRLIVEDGEAVRFTADFAEQKAEGFRAEFLEGRGYRPDAVVYSGDTRNDEPVAELLPAGNFIVPFLAQDAFKQHMAERHGAFVPSTSRELLDYLKGR